MADATFFENLGLEIGYVFLGGMLGLILMWAAAHVLPRIVDRLSPKIDDESEILRGNVAVAEYTGRIYEAVIIGFSIIVAASIIAGLM
jgi:hypothetical protein